MPYYETIIISRSDLSQPQVDALSEQYKTVITSNGGKVTKIEYAGLRSLAYKIKRNKKGHYVLMNIDAPAKALLEMDRQLRLNENVLRHLNVKVEKLDDAPSALVSTKNSEITLDSDFSEQF